LPTWTGRGFSKPPLRKHKRCRQLLRTVMTIGQYLIIATAFLLSCGTRNNQTASDTNKLDSKTERPIVEEAWMNYDTVDQVSYVDLYQYGRLKLPGRWKYSDGQPPRFFDYENSENQLLRLDRGLLDTMSFYSKRMTKAEILTKLYEQGTAIWRAKEGGQILTIEENQDNMISKLTIDPTNQMYLLCGIKDNKTMTLYLVPKVPDDLKSVDLLKKIYIEWMK